MSFSPQTLELSRVIARICAMGLLLALISMSIAGCAKREKVLEVKTPGGEVEIDKTTHPNGDVELEVKTEK